jgi:hypothetical protein
LTNVQKVDKKTLRAEIAASLARETQQHRGPAI